MNDPAAPPPQPTDAEVIAAIAAPPPPVPPRTYELALVMGGTVSSGAYTAGAVDFLIEALDCFAAEKTASGSPFHDVVLKVLCGTSGGAVTAAIAARALNYRFPPRPYAAPAPPGGDSVNPLYQVWVNQLDLLPMLATGDIAGSVPSLLNVKPIDDAIGFVTAYPGGLAVPPCRRDWLGAPVRLILTHTNLSGIPYDIGFGGGQSQRFIDHLDYVQYAVGFSWQEAPAPKPFEFGLEFAGPAAARWAGVGQYAASSAAFPLGFVTRLIDRPLDHYFYRAVCTATPPASAADLQVLHPDIEAILNTNNSPTLGNIRYGTVDGGVVDNEPVQLARIALAGIYGRLPSQTTTANRAVWLIDPFAGESDLTGFDTTGIATAAAATLNAALQQTRYSTADIVLALQPDNYSRYMLSATRQGLSGAKALATAGLGAFMGFACEAFRAHDFHLGRQNCRQFLLTQFRQSAQNPVFAAWTPAQKAQFIDSEGDLPIIPFFGTAAAEQTLPEWPAGAFDPADLKDAITQRLEAILVKELFPDSFFGRVFGAVAAQIPAEIAAGYAIDALESALRGWGLVSGT